MSRSMDVKDFGLYLSILHFCDRVAAKMERFRVDEGLWLADEDIRDMLYVSVQQVGEKASRLSGADEDYPDIDWREICGLRNILIHDYDSISPDIVWGVLIDDIPRLKRDLLENEDVRDFYEQTEAVSQDVSLGGGGLFEFVDEVVRDRDEETEER